MKNLILICLILFSFVVNAQKKKLVWDYPVKPDTEKWGKLESNKAKVEICQIPEAILKKVSTEDLFEICLQYPLINDIYAFNNYDDGVDKLISDFNGIRELFNRKDFVEKTLIRYKSKIGTLSSINEKRTSYEKGEDIVSISTLEILLSRSVSQANLSMDLQKEILQSLLSGYEGKNKMASSSHGLALVTNLWSRAHVIVRIDSKALHKLPRKNLDAIFFSGIIDTQTVSIINETSNQLIK